MQQVTINKKLFPKMFVLKITINYLMLPTSQAPIKFNPSKQNKSTKIGTQARKHRHSTT